LQRLNIWWRKKLRCWWSDWWSFICWRKTWDKRRRWWSFFGGGRGFNPMPCIYYAFSLPTELSSRGRWWSNHGVEGFLMKWRILYQVIYIYICKRLKNICKRLKNDFFFLRNYLSCVFLLWMKINLHYWFMFFLIDEELNCPLFFVGRHC